MWPSEAGKIKVELFQIWKKTSLHQSTEHCSSRHPYFVYVLLGKMLIVYYLSILLEATFHVTSGSRGNHSLTEPLYCCCIITAFPSAP